MVLNCHPKRLEQNICYSTPAYLRPKPVNQGRLAIAVTQTKHKSLVNVQFCSNSQHLLEIVNNVLIR
jgi:hypothetical protein